MNKEELLTLTLEEAIKHAEEVAEENQRVVDTKDVTIDMLFCDDEEIEERLTNYKRCAEEHRQLAEWLKDYKRLLEQQPCERFEWGIDGNVYKITKAKDGKEICQQVCKDAISRQAALNSLIDNTHLDGYDLAEALDAIENKEKLPPVTPQPKYGKWIDYRDEGFVECPFCGHATNCEDDIDELHYCFYCGAKMVEPQESEDNNG